MILFVFSANIGPLRSRRLDNFRNCDWINSGIRVTFMAIDVAIKNVCTSVDAVKGGEKRSMLAVSCLISRANLKSYFFSELI